MNATNVFDLTPALLRRREWNESVARGDRGPWRSLYRDGIDGLWAKKPAGEVVQLVIPFRPPTTVRITAPSV